MQNRDPAPLLLVHHVDRVQAIALADSIGYTPLFGALGAFDIIGATLLIILMRGVPGDGRPRPVSTSAHIPA